MLLLFRSKTARLQIAIEDSNALVKTNPKKQKICALNDRMTNERQGKPKCTKDKELWKPEKRVERKGDSIFQATRASKMRIRSRNEREFPEIPRNGTAATTKNREQITLGRR